MSCSGLRASEVTHPSDETLWYSEKGNLWPSEVRGKSTKGGAKQTRDAWMSDDVANDIHKFSQECGFSSSDP